jgi:hypothetical protein
MATTTNGLPYPVGTDLVVNGDDAIKALAQAVDTAVLPHAHVRARCTTALSAGPGAWNICWLDVFADAHGPQTGWALEAANRRVKILKSGVYLLQAAITMTGPQAVGIALSTDAVVFDRIASVPIGTINFSNSCSALRYIPANTYVFMQMYHSTAFNTLVDSSSSPCYLSIQALGGQ